MTVPGPYNKKTQQTPDISEFHIHDRSTVQRITRFRCHIATSKLLNDYNVLLGSDVHIATSNFLNHS